MTARWLPDLTTVWWLMPLTHIKNWIKWAIKTRQKATKTQGFSPFPQYYEPTGFSDLATAPRQQQFQPKNLLFGNGGSGCSFLQEETTPSDFNLSQYSWIVFLMLLKTSGFFSKYFWRGLNSSMDPNLIVKGCGELITLDIHILIFPSVGGALPVEYNFWVLHSLIKFLAASVWVVRDSLMLNTPIETRF